MKKNWFLCILLSFALVLGLMPGITMTAEAASSQYNIWVGGAQVTDDNASDVLGDGKVSYTPAEGDNAAILTLNGADISGSHAYYANNESNKSAIYAEGDLIIDLKSDSAVTGDAETSGSSYGIHVTGSLTIKGSGTLTATSGLARVDSVGVRGGIGFRNGVTVSGCKLVATGVESDQFTGGVYTRFTTVKDGGTIIATAGPARIGSDGIAFSETTIEEGSYLTSSGERYAIRGTVKNGTGGLGWTDTAGTQGKAEIEADEDGISITNYKKVQFPPEKAKITALPTAKTLTYSGSAQELVTAGAAEGGTIYYCLGEDSENEPTGSSADTSVPTGTDIGTYYVWYKAIGDDSHSDSAPDCVTVEITEPDKTELKAAIAEAEKLYDSIKDNKDYLSFASALSEAINNAKGIAANRNATAEDVSAAKEAITAARTTAENALGNAASQANVKAASTMVASAKNIRMKAGTLKKKAGKKTAISVVGNKGAVSYQLVSAKKGKKSFRKKIKVNPSTGQITLKKNLRRGTYKVKVNVYDAGDDKTNGGTQTVTFKVYVR